MDIHATADGKEVASQHNLALSVRKVNTKSGKNKIKENSTISRTQVSKTIDMAVAANNASNQFNNKQKPQIKNVNIPSNNPAAVDNNNGNKTFQGVPRREWLYVGNASQNVTADIVRKHITDKGIEDNEDLLIKELANKGRTKSFKVGLLMNFHDLINTPGFWPKDIIVRKFDIRRGGYAVNNNHNNNNNFTRSNSDLHSNVGVSNNRFLDRPYQYTTRM